MSLINRKVDYALRTLVYLAKNQSGSFVSSGDLSDKLRVPRIFLAKIFQALSKRRIVKTSRGKVGGVRLIDKGVSISAIISILDPTFALNRCLRKDGRCIFKNGCSMHRLLIEANKDFHRKYGKTTLLELANKGNN